MKIVIYIVLVLASAALHTYHPKSHSSTTPTHISKSVASEKADMNSIALNNTGAYQVAAQSN